MSKPFKPRGRRRRGAKTVNRKEDCIYFPNGVVVEALPGTTFKVKVERSNGDKSLEPITIMCVLKGSLFNSKVTIIKGDFVEVEVNPEDMYFSAEQGILKGTIIERKFIDNRPMRPKK